MAEAVGGDIDDTFENLVGQQGDFAAGVLQEIVEGVRLGDVGMIEVAYAAAFLSKDGEVGRPAMFVATVIAPFCPALAMISASVP